MVSAGAVLAVSGPGYRSIWLRVVAVLGFRDGHGLVFGTGRLARVCMVRFSFWVFEGRGLGHGLG